MAVPRLLRNFLLVFLLLLVPSLYLLYQPHHLTALAPRTFSGSKSFAAYAYSNEDDAGWADDLGDGEDVNQESGSRYSPIAHGGDGDEDTRHWDKGGADPLQGDYANDEDRHGGHYGYGGKSGDRGKQSINKASDASNSFKSQKQTNRLPVPDSRGRMKAGDASGAAVDEDLIEGGSGRGAVIMPKLTNETAKAELGRATWKFLHTMTLRFPEKPTADERQALNDYFHLFSRLYPCGDCAVHFQRLLEKYPPQTSSRQSASLWLCSLHNIINERLGKPEFDCTTLDETYDCGCGDDEHASKDAESEEKATVKEKSPTPFRLSEMERDAEDEEDNEGRQCLSGSGEDCP